MEIKHVKDGFLTTMAKEIIRGIINESIRNTTPAQLVWAIDHDVSLWGEAGGHISATKDAIPAPILKMGQSVRDVINRQYGTQGQSGFTTLVLQWLQEDQPIYYEIVMNTPDARGVAWLDGQVTEILRGCGFDA